MTKFHHREVNGTPATVFDAGARPEPGPIAVLPAGRGKGHADAVREAGGVVAELSDDTRGVIYVSYSNVDPLIEALEAHPEISWVQLPFAGIDNFAKRLTPFAERGLVVTSARGAYAQPVAEHALALTLAAQRNLQVRARATTWGPTMGLSLYGANVVILGAGGIAIEYLSLLRPFEVTSTVVRRSGRALAEADRTVTNDELDAVLPEADVVMLAAPATDETRHVMNAARLAAMKPSAVLVNVGRGPLVDTDALVAALDAEEIYGAALDVTDPEPLPDGHPLWLHERCLITPHSADTPDMTLPLLLTRVRDNVRGFLETGEFVGIVDPRQGY
ncbi:D-isomer specific 2-hydroxyacid dehydrogenase family protein [Gulosibacter faecalis]|uniref:D-isomer specific 2-hydroxyacid dehydrogenase family protein n=1 Tax=Gulosibacter faecalis TaxID=272240 RepID=A0ABW5V1V2_9MICO|nr:D-isomer specific 2-hydroxyacid dehydrogenase family protein [Gulosibacter faecalis]